MLRRILVAGILGILVVALFNCHQMPNGDKNLDKKSDTNSNNNDGGGGGGNPPSTPTAPTTPSTPTPTYLNPPTITLDNINNTVSVDFTGSANIGTGSIVFQNNATTSMVFKNNQVVKSGFSFNNRGTSAGNALAITGDSSNPIQSYTKIVATGFQDTTGNIYPDTAYYIGQTTLTNSPTVSFDPDHNNIVVAVPQPLTVQSSPSMIVKLGFTNVPGQTNWNTVSATYSGSSIFINQTLTSYPLITLQNVNISGGNTITYMMLDVPVIPPATLINMNAVGIMSVNFQTVNPNKSFSYTSYTSSNQIWDKTYLINNGLVNNNLSLCNNSAAGLVGLQKWVNWNITFSNTYCKKIEIYDGEAYPYYSDPANKIYSQTLTFSNSLITISNFCVKDHGGINLLGNSGSLTAGAKVENLIVRLYSAFGTYIETNFQSVVDVSGTNKVIIAFQGVEVPTVSVNSTYGTLGWVGNVIQSGNVYCDRIKILDTLTLFGDNTGMIDIATGSAGNQMKTTYKMFDSTVYEDALEWNNFVVDSRGVLTVTKKTTVGTHATGAINRLASTCMFTNSAYMVINQTQDITPSVVYPTAIHSAQWSYLVGTWSHGNPSCRRYTSGGLPTEPIYPSFSGNVWNIVDQYTPLTYEAQILSSGWQNSSKTIYSTDSASINYIRNVLDRTCSVVVGWITISSTAYDSEDQTAWIVHNEDYSPFRNYPTYLTEAHY